MEKANYIERNRKAFKGFQTEIERLAEKHNVQYLLEADPQDAEHSYRRYLEDGYTATDALKHLYENSGMSDDPSFA